MAVTTPPALTPVPPFPALSDRAAGTYNTKAYAFGTHIANVFNSEIEALALNVAANATDAASSATSAAESVTFAGDKAIEANESAGQAAASALAAAAATAASGAAPLWLSGATYAIGNVTYSIITLQTYRRKTAGSGVIDPSADTNNWMPLVVVEVITPANTSPASAAIAIIETPTLTGSAFYSLYSATHANTQVQVSTDASFSAPTYDSGSIAASVSAPIPAAILAVSTAYYWRIRYKNSRGTWSNWSAATSFTTAAVFAAYIATPTATPANFGDSFEGGFYTGMIWNELVQSASSYAIGTGNKAFVVADMTATPLVYAGQVLEVRSRANPANKMIGVVTRASGTALTINVTSMGGSGTFADWSIMAQYRVIVAPKSTGENTSIAYKNANTAAPAACGTLSEGRKATLAMVAADTSTVYPAAHWCNNLSIAGKTDWYLPARDELELCWRNLKPTADANYVSADRLTGATPNYMNLGSYGDTANTHGLDNNSSPGGAAHTSSVPAQVAASKNFRTGESEAFAYGSFVYWSASEYSATDAWFQYWFSSFPGFQGNVSKTSAYYVRAVRRSII